ncbi:MAG: class I SAM-dependent methyltransferase [Minisyncoccales bacterium]|jgi:ubiquinone/menaquinone biosynthesis C-methylase UbiE
MKEELAKKIIEDVKRKYDVVSERFSNSRIGSWAELDFLFNKYLEKGDKVLDVGCGNGRFYNKIAPKADYLGIDSSEKLIEIAKRSYPKGRFAVADVLNLPFENNRFDLVYAIGILHHIPSKKFRQKTLDEISRVLRLKGTAVITVWDIWEKTARRKMVVKEAIYNVLGLSQLDIGDVLLNWQGEDQFYFHSFSLNSLTKLCKKSKLKPVQFGKISSKKGGTNVFVVAVKQS